MVASRYGAPVERYGSFALEPADIAAYHEGGFLALPSFVDADELALLAGRVTALLERPEPRAEGMLYDYAAPHGRLDEPEVIQLLLPFDYDPSLFETRFYENAAAVARALLGGPIHYRGSHVISKPPRRNNPTPWHQDEAFWDPSAIHDAIAVWLPLGPATLENGCMQFLSGTHRAREVRPHRPLGGDPRVHGFEIDEATLESRREGRVPPPAGRREPAPLQRDPRHRSEPHRRGARRPRREPRRRTGAAGSSARAPLAGREAARARRAASARGDRASLARELRSALRARRVHDGHELHHGGASSPAPSLALGAGEGLLHGHLIDVGDSQNPRRLARAPWRSATRARPFGGRSSS